MMVTVKVVLKSGVTVPFVMDEVDAREVTTHFTEGKHSECPPYIFEVRGGGIAAWFDVSDVAAVVRETQPEPLVVKAPCSEELLHKDWEYRTWAENESALHRINQRGRWSKHD